jgi:hypothetical protein
MGILSPRALLHIIGLGNQAATLSPKLMQYRYYGLEIHYLLFLNSTILNPLWTKPSIVSSFQANKNQAKTKIKTVIDKSR